MIAHSCTQIDDNAHLCENDALINILQTKLYYQHRGNNNRMAK